jgi:hypothetical protein
MNVILLAGFGKSRKGGNMRSRSDDSINIRRALIFCGLYWLLLLFVFFLGPTLLEAQRLYASQTPPDLLPFWKICSPIFREGLQAIFKPRATEEYLAWLVVLSFPVWPLMAEYAMLDKSPPGIPVTRLGFPEKTQFRLNPEGSVRKGFVFLGGWFLIAFMWTLVFITMIVLIFQSVQSQTQNPPADVLSLWQLYEMVWGLMPKPWSKDIGVIAFMTLLLLLLPFRTTLECRWRRHDTLTLDAQGIACEYVVPPRMRRLMKIFKGMNRDSWRVSWDEIRLPLLCYQGSRLLSPDRLLFIETIDRRIFSLDMLETWQRIVPPGTPEIGKLREPLPVLREMERRLEQKYPGKEITREIGMHRIQWILATRAQKTLRQLQEMRKKPCNSA